MTIRPSDVSRTRVDRVFRWIEDCLLAPSLYTRGAVDTRAAMQTFDSAVSSILPQLTDDEAHAVADLLREDGWIVPIVEGSRAHEEPAPYAMPYARMLARIVAYAPGLVWEDIPIVPQGQELPALQQAVVGGAAAMTAADALLEAWGAGDQNPRTIIDEIRNEIGTDLEAVCVNVHVARAEGEMDASMRARAVTQFWLGINEIFGRASQLGVEQPPMPPVGPFASSGNTG